MIKKSLTIIGILIFSIALVIVLQTSQSKNTTKTNGFKRIFKNQQTLEKSRITLKKSSYTIISISSDSVYLYEYKKPYHIIKIRLNPLNKQDFFLSSIEDKDGFKGRNGVRFIQGNYFVVSGMTSMVYKVSSDAKKMTAKKIDSLPFYQSTLIDSNSTVVLSKVYLKGESRRMLKKINMEGRELNSYLPDKQSDGYFSNDGQFKYDTKSNRLIYMYYYQGKFTCLDTNLNVVYHAKTIDTVKIAKMRLKNLGNKTTQSTPPNIVNKRIFITENMVYVNSQLRADNEKSNSFYENNVIDVYKLIDGQYSHSFYIPKLGKESLSQFGIYKNKIIVLYSSTLVIFEYKNH